MSVVFLSVLTSIRSIRRWIARLSGASRIACSHLMMASEVYSSGGSAFSSVSISFFDLVHARADVGNDVRRKSGRGEIPDQVVVFRPLLINLLLDHRCKRFPAFLLVILVGTQKVRDLDLYRFQYIFVFIVSLLL